jgi:1-acyl-sn-glycerol-3-phosphate acyltransferase
MTDAALTPTIPDAKSALGYGLIYWTLVRPAIWNQFDSIRVQMVGRLPRPADGPLICYFNHPAWWDAYMGMIVDRALLRGRFSTYGMMETEQLRAFPFFRLCGAFSIERHPPRAAARGIAYISHKLQHRPGQALFIYPQGEIIPNDQRPLRLHTGTAHIIKRLGREAVLCPVALRYEFRGEQQPDGFIRFGPFHRAAVPDDVRTTTADLTRRLTDCADNLRDAVVADDMSQFCVLMRGKPGINRLFQFHWSGGSRR